MQLMKQRSDEEMVVLKISAVANLRDATFDYETPTNLVEKQFTCNGCKQERECPYAYDIYNIDGDCIADK